MKKITAIFTIFSILIGVFGCDNPVKNNDKNSNQGNTLNDSSLNDNFIGSISEYFYDFENDINVKFYRWDISTINQPILFDETTDTMNFRTFPEYLLSIEPGEIGEPFTDTNNNGQYDPGEPFIDQGNGLWELGEPFTDANNNGFFDQGETFEDVNGDGQWTGTERLYDVNGDCLWNDAETFEDWNADGLWTPAEPLSNEYINFGTWDPHEPYEDLNGNGMYDWREPFTDTNGDGTWTPQEPYEDLNGNGQWDDAEPYVELWGSFVGDFLSDGTALDIVACGCTHLGPNMNFHCGENGVYNPECGDTFLDTDGDGERDSAEPFEDIYPPFGEYNPDEQFDDWNGDGIWTAEDEPFTNLNPNAPGIPVWNDDEEFVDWNNDGEWTPAEPLLFEYHSNGIWDDAELFEDLDNDGIWDNEGEQFDDEDGDCLWSIGETFLDQPDDPSVAEWNSFTESHQLVNETLTKNTSVNITSSQIRHLNQLFWDFDLERYTPVVSDWDVKDTTLYFSDPYDSLIYQQSVTSLPSGNNSYYIDRSEWIGTSYVYTSGDSLFSITFHLKQKMVGADSLMYRRHADCNLNGIADPAEDFTDVNGNNQYDIGEPFEDLPNDMLDAAEPFLDRDLAGEPGYGVRNLDEPFLDLNCNNQWDPAETVDQGNGQWDDAEPEDLFYRTMEPNNLVVSFDNYPDLSNPRILMTINSEEWFSDCGIDNICPTDEDYEEPDTGEGNGILDDGEEFEDYNMNGICCEAADSVITYNGQLIRDVIEASQFDNVREKEVDNIDSLVTIYSNQIVEEVDYDPAGNNYYITKTKSNEEYNYHIFKENNHIYQLIHPSYFLPPGFWNNSPLDGPLEDGFWFENFTVDEVLYYTPGGYLRDGEYVFRDTTVSTSIGNYYITKSYSVDQDNVIVPARKLLGYLDPDGNVICYANESLENIASVNNCPKDTTFMNVFKITNEIDMTLIGPGIRYGEKTITWLASNHGMIKEQLFIRWNEAPWESSSEWIEYSKLELAEFREVNNGSGGLMRDIFGQTKSVNLNTLGNEGDLDNDPYEIRRTAGFQRVTLPSNND